VTDEPKDWANISSIQTYTLSEAHKILGTTHWTDPLSSAVPEWLVPGLLQRSALHVLSSDSGTCKSWLGLSLMLSGIYGIPVLGQQPTTPFSSIYLAADSPAWDIGQQLRKLMRAHSLSPKPDPPSFIMPLGFLFEREDHLKALASLVNSWDIDAFFIDVMLYTHTGDENDNAYMARTVLRSAKFLRDELGLSVFFLHHNSKPKPDMPATFRGAGTIVQAAEHHLTLSRRRSEIILQPRKIRGESVLPESLSFSLTQTENGGRMLKPTESPDHPSASEPLPVTDVILQAIIQLGSGATRKAIHSIALAPVGVTSATKWIDNRLYKLAKDGIIRNTNGVWSLATINQ
jgi:hypothetical protein